MFALGQYNDASGRTKPGDASRARDGDDGGTLLLWRSSACREAGGSGCERIACDGDGDVGRPPSSSKREVEGTSCG